VPIGAAGLSSAKIVKNATLKVYPGFPHGCPQPMQTRSMPICSSSYRKLKKALTQPEFKTARQIATFASVCRGAKKFYPSRRSSYLTQHE